MSIDFLKQAEGVEQERDSLGGGFLVESGADEYTIDIAYLGVSSGGANSVTLHLKNDAGTLVRQTIYVTSGTAKGCKTYSVNKQGKKVNLPGFSLANNLSLLVTGKPLSELSTVDKTINVYNSGEGKEIPTVVKAFDALKDQKIIAGIIKQVVDKNVKDANNNYVPSGETREENEIDKFFCAKQEHYGLTVSEITNGNTPGDDSFINKWKAKWEGKVKDKSTKNTNPGVSQGVPKATPTTSLFN